MPCDSNAMTYYSRARGAFPLDRNSSTRRSCPQWQWRLNSRPVGKELAQARMQPQRRGGGWRLDLPFGGRDAPPALVAPIHTVRLEHAHEGSGGVVLVDARGVVRLRLATVEVIVRNGMTDCSQMAADLVATARVERALD